MRSMMARRGRDVVDATTRDAFVRIERPRVPHRASPGGISHAVRRNRWAGTLKTRWSADAVGGQGRSTAAVLTDFLSALSHPVESNAKGNARRPLATPSVPVEEGYGARRTRDIEKLGSRLNCIRPVFTAGQIAEKYDKCLNKNHLALSERRFLGGARFLARASDSEDDDDMETRPQKTP